MVFVYPEAHRGGYWMKDTLIPLDIAFSDARGKILRIFTMQPCRRDPCRIYDPGVAYRSALEVNAGRSAAGGSASATGSPSALFDRGDGQTEHVGPVVVARRVEPLPRLQEQIGVQLGVGIPSSSYSGPAR